MTLQKSMGEATLYVHLSRGLVCKGGRLCIVWSVLVERLGLLPDCLGCL